MGRLDLSGLDFSKLNEPLTLKWTKYQDDSTTRDKIIFRLAALDWVNINLTGANFSHLELRQNHFHLCEMRQANLSGANISDCIIDTCNLNSANLEHACLVDLNASARIVKSSFISANFKNSRVSNKLFQIESLNEMSRAN